MKKRRMEEKVEEEEGEEGKKGRGLESLRRWWKFNKIIPRKGISWWPKIP